MAVAIGKVGLVELPGDLLAHELCVDHLRKLWAERILQHNDVATLQPGSNLLHFLRIFRVLGVQVRLDALLFRLQRVKS